MKLFHRTAPSPRLLPLLAVLVGCSGIERPPTELPPHWQGAVEQAQTRPDPSPGLLDLVESPELRALALDALARNPEVGQTALRVREAEAVVRQRRAQWLPWIDGGADAGRSSIDFGDLGSLTESSYAVGLSLSWEIDLWGRLADAQSSAEADVDALAADHRAARNSLAGLVLRRALEAVSIERIIAVESRRLETLEFNQDVIRDRYLIGRGKLSDLESARSVASQTRAVLAERREALAATRRALAVLRGDLALDPVQLPDSVPAVRAAIPDVPAVVLAERPDVRAALRRVAAADLLSRAETKALLPRFSISAGVQMEDESLGDVLRGDPLWNLLGNLTAPLYQGGRLRARADEAELAAERGYLAYQQVLLDAVLEVEDSLGQDQALAAQTLHLEEALAHARDARATFERRYSDGLDDILNLLTAQQAAFNTERSLEEVRLAHRLARVDLGLALGLGVDPGVDMEVDLGVDP